MLRYALTRIGQAALILLGVAMFTFALIYLVPVDPAAEMAGRSATPQQIESVRHEAGLDQPLPVQFGVYLLNLTRGNLGQSYVQRSPVASLLLRRVPATMLLLSAAIVAELAIGLVAGIVAAIYRGRALDRAVMLFALVGVSTP